MSPPELPPVSSNYRCRKCGVGNEALYAYCCGAELASSGSPYPLSWLGCSIPQEHLHRKCITCGFGWVEAVAGERSAVTPELQQATPPSNVIPFRRRPPTATDIPDPVPA